MLSGRNAEDSMRCFLRSVIFAFEEMALEAGHVIMQYYDEGFTCRLKDDASPVTEADRTAEAIIEAGLQEKFPHIPIVAEEAVSSGKNCNDVGECFFLVDPLDGTKEFIHKRSDFTVNIALIDCGVPVAGVVYAPARDVMFVGYNESAQEIQIENFQRKDRKAIFVSKAKRAPVAVASRSHRTAETDVFLQDYAITKCVSIGSSLKFCLLARGEADIYPRFGPTMQWDTAAGDAVLRAAGGQTCGLDGSCLSYGSGSGNSDARFMNPYFIAYGQWRPEHHS